MQQFWRIAAIVAAMSMPAMPAAAQSSLAGNWKITAANVPCVANLAITGSAAAGYAGQATWSCTDGQQVTEGFTITAFSDHVEFVGKVVSVNKGSWLAETLSLVTAPNGTLQGTATDGKTNTTVTLTRQ